jgi:hypothetical protein
MLPPRDGKPWKRPKADYVWEKEHRTESETMDADVKFS